MCSKIHFSILQIRREPIARREGVYDLKRRDYDVAYLKTNKKKSPLSMEWINFKPKKIHYKVNGQ